MRLFNPERYKDSHFIELVRHFFQRFFDNDLVARDGEMRVTIVHILALLAVPGIMWPFFLMPKYVYLAAAGPVTRLQQMWVDEYFFISFAMVLMGFVTVLEWDALFPDSRDYAILIPLPLSLIELFRAKAAALAVFLIVFSIDLGALSAILFPLVAGDKHTSLFSVLRTSVAHTTAVMAGCAFIFLSIVALQGVLLNVLSIRWFRKLSPFIQSGSVFVMLLVLLLYFRISAVLPSVIASNHHSLGWFPPFWFLGLYETIAGRGEATFVSLARAGGLSVGIVFVAALAAYALSYRRHVRKILEAQEDLSLGPSFAERVLSRAADRYLVRDPLERATFYFVTKTTLRSKKHRLLLAAYVGVGAAVAFEGLSGILSRRLAGPGASAAADSALMSLPLILSFFLLSGLRYVYTMPAELAANWVFRISENDGRMRCLAGARKATASLAIVPLFLALLPFYAVLWGWQTALFHVLYGATLSVVLMQLLLLYFPKIPFTCSYLPGKANVTLTWFFYWTAFAMYAFVMARLERWLMQNPLRQVLFFAIAAVALRVIEWFRTRLHDETFTLTFEEQPEPAVRTLDISNPALRALSLNPHE
ncbi:MAG: hypothetical protein ACRD8O_19420 [Bryobacteraceae bacterium]